MYDLVLMTGSFSTGLSAAGCAAVGAVPCAEALAVTSAGSRKAKFLREYFIKPPPSRLLPDLITMRRAIGGSQLGARLSKPLGLLVAALRAEWLANSAAFRRRSRPTRSVFIFLGHAPRSRAAC